MTTSHETQLRKLRQQRVRLLKALIAVAPRMPPADAICHYGICEQRDCENCQRVAEAHAAIKECRP